MSVVRPVSPVRLIDPRGHRFGAALSAVILGLALAAGAQILVVAIALALGTSALFGTRYSVLGRPWPLVRRVLALGPAEPEPEYAPRFAQALGSIGLLLGVALFGAGFTTLGWVPVIGVAALQTLLAVTGYCVGCRLYFLRWWIPSLFERIARRTTIEPESSIEPGSMRRASRSLGARPERPDREADR